MDKISRPPFAVLNKKAIWKPLILTLLLGAGAGFINGLLGTGGGIFLVFVLRRLARKAKPSDPLAREQERDVFAGALSVMLPISVFSSLHYARAGAMDLGAFSPLILPCIIGGVLGGFLLDRLSVDWLRRLFALLVLCSGVLMIVRR